MSENYDQKQLKAGDAAAYSDGTGWASWNQNIKLTKVERLTATQIVMVDGSRFSRETGRRIGSTGNSWLLDPKGEQVRSARARMEATVFGYALTQWDKQRNAVKSLEAWQECLKLLAAEVASAQKQIKLIEKEFKA